MPRERLFHRLFQLRDTPLIWLSAPAGYGKSTLVSSYLQATARSHIWYQCDAGDSDIASFFYYLNMARERCAPRSRVPLPAFLPEHYSAIPTFTRNYFRSLFASFAGSTTVVFDNLQEVPSDATIIQMLPLLAEQIPSDVQIIVVSRGDPPPTLGRWIAADRLVVFSAEDLKLSRSETEEVIAAAGIGPVGKRPRSAEELYTLSQGWAAGLALLLRLGAEGGTCADYGIPGSQAVFDYLASEVFSRLDDTLQEFLLETSCLQPISANVARHLTGRQEAQSILGRLVQDNVFTTYRPAAGTYEYHPLFRGFLLGRARQRNGAASQQSLMTRAAVALENAGDAEAAISLYLQAESWDAAAGLIEREAADLLSQARIQTLSAWINAIPVPLAERRAWLTYWRGMYQFTTSFTDARATLEHAYALFCRDAERLGQMLACAAIFRHINACYADIGRCCAGSNDCRPWFKPVSRFLRRPPNCRSRRDFSCRSPRPVLIIPTCCR